MLRTALIITLLAGLVACQSGKPSKDISLQHSFDSIFSSNADFSGVVLIADHGTPTYFKAFGFRDFAGKIPMDTGAIFELASVSKQFTSMIIMMLEEKGLLKYDDSVSTYLPQLPYRGITIRHLLNHTSGLPDYQAVMDKNWDKTKVAGNDDNIAYLSRYRPAAHFQPGARYEYSNTGYMLLASIAEKASGQDFIDLCRSWIFRPLSLSKTDIRTKTDKLELTNMAWGHLFVPERNLYVHADSFPAFNYSIWLGNRKGPGRISGSASDLLRWDQALYRNNLVSKKTLDEAYTPAQLNNGDTHSYGFGWILAQHPAHGKIVYHTGDNPGYRTIIVRLVDANKTIILLNNNEHKKFRQIVDSLMAIMARDGE